MVSAVQIGTVCTLPSYRKKGLVRDLMERAHAHWDGRCEFSYLFANESVLDFYQQFGYRPVRQHRFHCSPPTWRPPEGKARLLDTAKTTDRMTMRGLAQHRAPVSRRVGARSQAWLWLFHAMIVHPEHLLFIEDLGTIAVSQIVGNTLHVYDLVGRESISLAEVFSFIGSEAVTEVSFHFTPDLMGISGIKATPADDAHLFVRGDFPQIDGPFVFPATSEA